MVPILDKMRLDSAPQTQNNSASSSMLCFSCNPPVTNRPAHAGRCLVSSAGLIVAVINLPVSLRFGLYDHLERTRMIWAAGSRR